MTAITVYPDAHPETTSIDGIVAQDNGYEGARMSWAVARAAAGNKVWSGDWDTQGEVWDNGFYCNLAYFRGDTDTGSWIALYRSIIVFDTSKIPPGAKILSATLRLRGFTKAANLGVLPNVNIYKAHPLQDAVLVGTDFARIDSDPLCDLAISYANWVVNGYNYFELNALGLSYINKFGVTKIGVRNANYDVAGVAPTAGATGGVGWWQAEGISYHDQSYVPALTVEYTLGDEAPPINQIVTLEAGRNIEMATMGRIYVDRLGNLNYESRYKRSL
jgi:hypothetical protein